MVVAGRRRKIFEGVLQQPADVFDLPPEYSDLEAAPYQRTPVASAADVGLDGFSAAREGPAQEVGDSETDAWRRPATTGAGRPVIC